MREIVALSFKVVVEADTGMPVGHERYRCDGEMNRGLAKHLNTYAECRVTIAKDLREFATLIEEMGR